MKDKWVLNEYGLGTKINWQTGKTYIKLVRSYMEKEKGKNCKTHIIEGQMC